MQWASGTKANRNAGAADRKTERIATDYREPPWLMKLRRVTAQVERIERKPRTVRAQVERPGPKQSRCLIASSNKQNHVASCRNKSTCLGSLGAFLSFQAGAYFCYARHMADEQKSREFPVVVTVGKVRVEVILTLAPGATAAVKEMNVTTEPEPPKG